MMRGYAIVVTALAGFRAWGVAGVSFGPQNCVSLTRSPAGSCVISTECKGLDTSGTEFAFDCSGDNGDVVRHSFGFGGFDEVEEFDTEVKCSSCASAMKEAVEKTAAKKVKKVEVPPEPAPLRPLGKMVKHAAMQAHQAPRQAEAKNTGAVDFRIKHKSSAKAKSQWFPEWNAESDVKLPLEEESPKDLVQYGPNDCVSTHRSKEGHCIMSTNCKGQNLAHYEFGLVCVDERGYPVKHLFGKGSFDEVETFDTLVKCDKCLGLEDVPDAVHLAGEVSTMAKEVAQITKMMVNLSANVQQLNVAVGLVKPAKAPAPAPAPAEAAPAAAEPVKFIHQHVSHGNLRHRHHGRRYMDYDRYDDRYEDDDSDESEDDEDDGYDS